MSLLRFGRRSAAFLVFGTLALSACQSPRFWVEDEQTLSIGAAGVANLACKTHNGAIRSTAGGPESFEVVVRRRGGGQTEEDARACLDAIEITQDQSGDKLSLGWRWDGVRRSGWGAAVAFEIEQPAAVSLIAETHNGRVAVAGLQRGVDLSTHNGQIDIDDCRGPVRASSHNGSISGEIDSREVDLETHNGGVNLTLRGDGPVGGEVRTHNGRVALRVDGDISTRLVCSTHNGGVRVHRSFDEVVHKRNVLVADLGEGGPKLDVETHNGAIIVR